MRAVVDDIQKYYSRGVILIISNPLNILTYKVCEWMNLPNGMVFCSGRIRDFNGYVVREYGGGGVPVWSHVTVGGISIKEFRSDMKIAWDDKIKKQIAEQNKVMRSEIIRKKSRTYYDIVTCVCQIVYVMIN